MALVKTIIHPRAFRHGLTEQQIRHAFATGVDTKRIRLRDADRFPPSWGIIGYDEGGRNIELVATPLANGDVLIFHARKLTKGFAREMREAKRL